MQVVALKAGLVPLESTSLAEQVADRIVDAIVTHQLSGGDRLIETELAAGLQVSRIPVREAMRILESQGIVVAAPRRGTRVVTFDAAWALQLHDVRVAIEQLCAKITARSLRRNPAARARLDVCMQDLSAAAATESWTVINRSDVAFHTALFEIADAPLLTTLWTAIARHVLIMFSIETYRDPNFKRIIAEHRSYLDVLLEGQPAAIDKEIRLHVAGFKTFVRSVG